MTQKIIGATLVTITAPLAIILRAIGANINQNGNMSDVTVEILLKFIMCHAVGDYVLQTDYMASAKGKDWYVLIMHCICYCVPFAVVFGIGWKLAVIFVTHVVTDALKARYHKINLAFDQIIHFLVALIYV